MNSKLFVAGWSVSDLVAQCANQHPDAVAVSSGQCALSYHDLITRADSLAGHLLSFGVEPEVVVGLCSGHTPALIAGALGIMRAGAAYLPLDPSFPPKRLASLLEEAQISTVIADSRTADLLPPGNWRIVELDPQGQLAHAPASSLPVALPRATPGNLAYVIYTSGSTGTPKGVEITQENLLNLVQWHRDNFGVTSSDRASQLAGVGFDAAVWEIWPYLTAGATLCLPEDQTLRDIELLRAWLINEAITIAFVPTPMAEQLLAQPWPPRPALRLMLTGADTLHHYPPANLPFLLVNNYGPTECTVVTTSGFIPAQDHPQHLPPIGKPIRGVCFSILDDKLREVPSGTPGELYIGGLGVARGYRNQPALTAERFIPDPCHGIPGGRLYRSGDLVRLLPDGQIAFLGRVDDQVKIRGFRVEPEEIVTALNMHPAVKQSAVMAREAAVHDRQLVVYVVPRPGCSVDLMQLREFLQSRLPDYMVPARFVVLDVLPLTPNGKVDRAALPPPADELVLREDKPETPSSGIERAVASMVSSLLGLERVGPQENFFALGGHSLLGTQLIARIRSLYGIDLSLRTIFEAPTIAQLSAQVAQSIQSKVETMTEEELDLYLMNMGLDLAETREQSSALVVPTRNPA